MSSATHQTILDLITSSEYYSAHQKARTTATRLLSPRNGPAPTDFDKKAQDAASLLWETSRRLLEKGQVGSGADLAGMLVETWKSRGVECGEEQRAQILQLIALIGSSGTWRKTFTDAVFSWSSKTGSGPAGDAAVHAYLGEILFKEQDYHNASLHLLLSFTPDSARTLADVLFAWSKLDPEGPSAVGRYAARGTLSYLESESILSARVFLSTFLSLVLASNPSLLLVRYPFPAPNSPLALSSSAPTDDELLVTKLASLNFLQLAVKTCQAGIGESVEKIKGSDGSLKVQKGKGRQAWKELVVAYEAKVGWLKTPEGRESTQEIGTVFFGIAPPRPAGNAMMDMLGSMFGGGAPAPAPAIRGR